MKKLISLITSLTIALTAAAGLGTAYASAEETDTSVSESGALGEDVKSGVYNGLTYDYNSEKAVITGSDGVTEKVTIPAKINGRDVVKIEKYAFENSPVKEVTFEEGITVIPGYCFAKSNITKLTIPSTVTTIQNQAFQLCRELREITIAEGVKTIGEGVFEFAAIKELWLPDSLEKIGTSAFGMCEELEKVRMPEKIDEVGSWFVECPKLKEVTLPKEFKKMSGTFTQCRGLESIVLSEGLETLNGGFYGCTSLKSVYIPKSVTKIGADTFKYCSSGLVIMGEAGSYAETFAAEKKISFNVQADTGVTDDGFEYIQKYNGVYITGYSGTNKNITIPVEINGKTVAGIEKSAFYQTDIESVIIEAQIKEIPERCFYEAKSLRSVVFPDGLEKIDILAFSDCGQLENIQFPESLTVLGSRSFFHCDKIESVELPEGLEEINAAFSGCVNLKEITIPAKVHSPLGFTECKNLKKVNFPSPCYIADFGSDAFAGCSSLESITIPDSITFIWFGTFENCASLKEVYIPESVTYIYEGAFHNSPLIGIKGVAGSYAETYAKENNIPFNQDNLEGGTCGDWMYATDGSEITVTGYTGNETELVIPSEMNGLPVTSIAIMSDPHIKKVTKITFPESLTHIGHHAFTYCDALKEIYLPDSIKSFDESVFLGCPNLEKVRLPEGLTEISTNMFASCGKLKDVKIPDSVTHIGGYAFSNCKALETIDIPESVTHIGEYAFSGCENIKKIDIPENVVTIEKFAFNKCKSIKTLKLPENIETISVGLLSGCDSLEKMRIPAKVTRIETGAFSNCPLLRRIIIPDGVTHLGHTAFGSCKKLSAVYVPDTLRYSCIGVDVFGSCPFVTVCTPKNSYAAQYAKEGGIRCIELDENFDTVGFDANIDKDVIDALSEGEELSITSSSCTAVFDADSVAEIRNNNSNGNISFTYSIIDINTADAAIQDQLGADDVLMSFELTDKDGEKVLFSSYDNEGEVVITVSYEAPPQVNDVTVYYIEPDGTMTDINSLYDPDDRTVSFSTTHFSNFAIKSRIGSIVSDKVSVISVDKNGIVSWTKADKADSYQVIKVAGSKTYYGKKTENTSYQLTSVPKNAYTIIVRTYQKNGSYKDSAPLAVNGKNKLGTAHDLSISDSGVIKWAAADNAAAYKIAKTVNGKTYYGSKITGTSYKLNGLTASAYTIRVIAYDMDDSKTWSAELKVPARQLGTVIDAKVGNNGVVSWTAVDGAVAYKVGKIVGNKTYYGSRTDKTSYKITVPKGEYTIFVAAYDKNGAKSIGPKTKITDTAKAADLKLSSDSKKLSWSTAEGAVKYQVAKIINGRTYYGSFVTGTSYTFKNAPKANTLIYVIAFDKNNKTSYSNIFIVK